VALITRVFSGLSKMTASSESLPDLHRVIFPHPLNHLPEDEIQRITCELQSEVFGALLQADRQLPTGTRGQ
jgi:hypothetical protein